MQKYNFSHCGPKITESTLASLEKQLGCKLPEDYLGFLLEHNGGYPEKPFFHCEELPVMSMVDWLCAIDDDLAKPNPHAHIITMSRAYALWGSIVPSDMLIIGSVDNDDPLMLSIRGGRQGRVFVKRMGYIEPASYEELATRPEQEVYEVAESFVRFMEALDYSPDE
jgi:SMI1 / KNR4 family (SUKH-1)